MSSVLPSKESCVPAHRGGPSCRCCGTTVPPKCPDLLQAWARFCPGDPGEGGCPAGPTRPQMALPRPGVTNRDFLPFTESMGVVNKFRISNISVWLKKNSFPPLGWNPVGGGPLAAPQEHPSLGGGTFPAAPPGGRRQAPGRHPGAQGNQLHCPPAGGWDAGTRRELQAVAW